MTFTTLSMIGLILLSLVIEFFVLLFGFSLGYVTASNVIKDELAAKFKSGEFIFGEVKPETST